MLWAKKENKLGSVRFDFVIFWFGFNSFSLSFYFYFFFNPTGLVGDGVVVFSGSVVRSDDKQVLVLLSSWMLCNVSMSFQSSEMRRKR